MGADVCELVVYTQNGAVTFQVKATADNFEDRVAEALEEGTVILELVDGGKIILCAINVVAIEVHAAAECSNSSVKISLLLPPLKKGYMPFNEPCLSPFYDRPRRV